MRVSALAKVAVNVDIIDLSTVPIWDYCEASGNYEKNIVERTSHATGDKNQPLLL